MDVHFITIEVSVVRRTVSIMESQSLLFRQDSGDVSHHRWLVKCRLAVDDQHISVVQVPVHNFAADLDLVSDTVPLVPCHVLE